MCHPDPVAASAVSPSLDAVRAQFPALAQDFAFLENAGGSQVPGCVIDAIARFMAESYVQTGAGYHASDRATETFHAAHEFTNLLVNGVATGRTVLGPSSTALAATLAGAYANRLGPGDEVVVSVANHEANINHWVKLERIGVQVRWWGVDPDTGASSLEALARLLSPKTRLVCFPQTSNLLGDVADVAAVARLAHDAGARVVVDGVAYASHGAPDVAAWDADFYFYSAYKVYGPHIAVLYGRSDAWAELEGPNHFFVPREELPRKFQLGCVPYEACAGIVALGEYLAFLGGGSGRDRGSVEAAYREMRRFEAPLAKILTDYLATKPGVRLVGPREGRVPTVSFVSERTPSDAVARHGHSRGFGIRHGHMYSHRLCEAMGVPPEPGVVRVSAVHYNTPDEITRLCEALDDVL
jgi:cysteine desulfurase family protein (TIGR01976 family)